MSDKDSRAGDRAKRGRGSGGNRTSRGNNRGPRGTQGGPSHRGQRRGTYPRAAPTSSTPTIVHSPTTKVETVAVRRATPAKQGRPVDLIANAFRISLADSSIYHYDVALLRGDKPDGPVPVEIMSRLQTVVAPNLFKPRIPFDGQRNMYSIHILFDQDSRLDYQIFDVTLEDIVPAGGRPRVHQVRIKRVNEVNAEVIHHHAQGLRGWDDDVQTALQALNITLRSEPIQEHPFKYSSFFIDGGETRGIGAGIELWRGYFQSFRVGLGGMIVNVDISTGMMYKRGELIATSLDFLRTQELSDLVPGVRLNESRRIALQNFLSGCQIVAPLARDPNTMNKWEIKRVTKLSARLLAFEKDGEMVSVADYWAQTPNEPPLRFPDLPCVEVGREIFIPIEKCTVLPGQVLRNRLPDDCTSDMVRFATMLPANRLRSITNGLPLMNYKQSEYLQQFGMVVDPEPIRVRGFVLSPPGLLYGEGSLDPKVTPRSGVWNMIEKKVVRPVQLMAWIVVSFDYRFTERDAPRMVQGLIRGMESIGIQVQDTEPKFYRHSPQSNMTEMLDRDSGNCRNQKGKMPQLVVVILPEGGDDVYTGVKYWGDAIRGVPTQCLKSKKAKGANIQYWVNVCLKINVKLGGINSTLDPAASYAAMWLFDPVNPTLVMGADVMHPPPKVDKPSYASIVGSVDANASKYVATIRLQAPRVECIEKFGEMAKSIIQQYIDYRRRFEKKEGDAAYPKRIVFYRDGVDEGQFAKVKEKEIKALKDVLRELNINAKITFIIVGKAHHMRFFPQKTGDGDRLGNCLPGTLIDQGVSHPVNQDFYLYSHASILGTSRPPHYSVLLDENEQNTDQLAAISYVLCHVYARCTRSVSMPAPVYYADIVCSRAKNHFDPNLNIASTWSDSGSVTTGSGKSKRRRIDKDKLEAMLTTYRDNFKPLHANQAGLMYFS